MGASVNGTGTLFIYHQFLVCTANGKECVFPFKYKGITYNTCTKVESDNGKAWCALELDSKGSGEVIIGKWADCDSVCLVEPNPRGPGSSKHTSVLSVYECILKAFPKHFGISFIQRTSFISRMHSKWPKLCLPI